MFSGGIERDQWHEMGQNTRDNFKLYSATQKKKKTFDRKTLASLPDSSYLKFYELIILSMALCVS